MHSLLHLAGGERGRDGAQVGRSAHLRGAREERVEEVKEVAKRVRVMRPVRAGRVEHKDVGGVVATSDREVGSGPGRDGALEVHVQLDLRQRRDPGVGDLIRRHSLIPAIAHVGSAWSALVARPCGSGRVVGRE